MPRLGLLVVGCLMFALSSPVLAQRAKPKKSATIGVVVDGPWVQNKTLRLLVEKEVRELVQGEFTVTFPADKYIEAQWTAASVGAALDKLLADPQVDIVYAFGVVASNEAGRRKSLAKPVIAPFIVDRKIQGLPFDRGASGRKNLNYLDWPWSMERDLKAFTEIVNTTDIVFLANKYFLDAVPGIADRIKEQSARVNTTMTIVAVGADVDQALAAIPAGAKAVYMAPLIHLSPPDFKRLLDGLTKRRIASFSALGEIAVREGVLAGLRPADSFVRIARRVALNTQRILIGDDPSRFSVALRLSEQLSINMKTARAIGLSPSWAVITEAFLIERVADDVKRKLTLVGVVREALTGNVDIKAVRQVVVAGKANIRGAKANLLPTLDISTSARLIDADRAENSFGTSPERLWTGDINLTQVLWSEKAWAGLDIERKLQVGRTEQLEQTKLDVAVAVGVAYLNILRAQSIEQIQRNNLKVTRANLDLARTRVDVGSSSRADVYRWEAQIANDRKTLIESSSQRNVAEIELRRILHRPLEERFTTAETGLTDPMSITGQEALFKLVNDPWTFRLFREFMIEEAARQSPEIKRLAASLAAQRRALKSSKRAVWSPTVALSASVTQRFFRGGAGSDDAMGLGDPADGLNWFVGLNLALPLYEGGKRYADIDRARADEARLSREMLALKDRIGQRAASSLHQLGASYAGIGLSRQAAEASKKNYDLVSDAYSKGAVRVVDLLDAQNAWLQSNQVIANSIYGFLIDWMNVQRSVGRFDMLLTESERAAFTARALQFVTARKAQNK